MNCMDAIVIPPSNGFYRGWNGSEWLYGSFQEVSDCDEIEQFLEGLGWGS